MERKYKYTFFQSYCIVQPKAFPFVDIAEINQHHSLPQVNQNIYKNTNDKNIFDSQLNSQISRQEGFR